jgi:hypothetical protein
MVRPACAAEMKTPLKRVLLAMWDAQCVIKPNNLALFVTTDIYDVPYFHFSCVGNRNSSGSRRATYSRAFRLDESTDEIIEALERMASAFVAPTGLAPSPQSPKTVRPR